MVGRSNSEDGGNQPPDYPTEDDFVEKPSKDFFCPVTLELLTDPYQTKCCGNHLSPEIVNRLQRDGKPCPMCKEPQLVAELDKYMKRRVNNLRVRCHYKESGCEWEGEVCEFRNHVKSCPKCTWNCNYCDIQIFFEVADVQSHLKCCTKFPVECPNFCGIDPMPRCDLEAHLTICPLQEVACDYAEVGCAVRVLRKDLAQHMEERQQDHILNATLSTFRLTRDLVTQKQEANVINESAIGYQATIAVLEKQLVEKEQMITEKDRELTIKDVQLQEYARKVSDKEQQIKDRDKRLGEQDHELVELKKQVKALQIGAQSKLDQEKAEYFSNGYTTLRFKINLGYQFQCKIQGYILFIEANLDQDGFLYINAIMSGYQNSENLHWPVDCVVHIRILNQLGDYSHYCECGRATFSKPRHDDVCTIINRILSITQLRHNEEKGTKYLIDSYQGKGVSFEIQAYIKMER